MFQQQSGASGTSLAPHQRYDCMLYNDLYCPKSSQTSGNPARGFGYFKYSKCKIKVTAQNWTLGLGSNLNTIATRQRLPMVIAMKAVASGLSGAQFPIDTDWPANMFQKSKYIPPPLGQPVFNSSGVMVGTSLVGKPPTKKLTATYRPWRIEKVPYKSYVAEEDYVTQLSATPQAGSTIALAHFIDVMCFNPFYLQSLNIPMQGRFTIQMTVWGTFFKPMASNPGAVVV